MSAAVLAGVTRRFGDVAALDGLDLVVPDVGAHGLLGVNGAGKSTALRAMLGLLRVDAGAVAVLGAPVRPGRPPAGVGYLPQHPAFEAFLTAREVVALHADLLGVRVEADAALARVGLAEAAGRRVAGFSGGMKQRLGLAVALLGEPRLLLLDEPESALDPVGRAEVLALVRDLARDRAVLMSSHILDDVQRVCETVSVLHRGRVRATDTVAALRAQVLRPRLRLGLVGDDTPVRAALAAAPWVTAVADAPDGGLEVEVTDPDRAARALPGLLAAADVGLRRLEPVEPDLEAAFLRIVAEADA